MKVCTKCKVEKELSLFTKAKQCKSGYSNICKGCTLIYYDNWSLKVGLVIKKRDKTLTEAQRKERNKIKHREWREKNKEHVLRVREAYKAKTKTGSLKSQGIKTKPLPRKPVPKRILKTTRTKSATKQTREEINKRLRAYCKNRYATDAMYKLKRIYISRTWAIFRKNRIKKPKNSIDILGADFEVVKKHIERQFKKGMSWDNHGHLSGCWHIDHKIPLSSAKTEEDILALCHYRNLQPLWSGENLSKGKIILPIQASMPL